MIRASLTSLTAAGLLTLAGCIVEPGDARPELTSFDVEVLGLYAPASGGERPPLGVVSECFKKHGGEANVPAELRGTPECPYAIPRGKVEIEVEIAALKAGGETLTSFNGPISFRVVPGDMPGGYETRTVQVANGTAKATIVAAHLYGKVQVWAEDAPPEFTYVDGKLPENQWTEPPTRTWATGLSQVIHFEEPTIAKVQIPDGFDNRTSPFIGQFLNIGRAPENGGLKQSCTDDPENDGKDALLVVTGTDPTGFFVTDLTACRQKELTQENGSTVVRVPEPSGFLPGTFGSMFIYNYSFPEGLEQGDVLWSVSGAVQEFTATTQLTFPSWIVAEKVRSLPEDQRDKWLKLVPPTEINLRTCGLDDAADPFVTDLLCGHNRRNLKMESLESGLVTVKNVRFSNAFTRCDLDGDGEVPFFCEQPGEQGGWIYGPCGEGGNELEMQEMACNIECVTGQGPFVGKVCTEEATFTTFGQFIAELAGPGPAEAGLDPSLPQRTQEMAVSAASTLAPRGWGPGIEVRLWCNTPVRWKFGSDQVVATDADAALAANTRLEHLLVDGESHLAIVADGTPAPDAKCWVAQNPGTRINVVTKDAIPELKPNCNPDDPDAESARQCQFLRGARFDLTGHLRHLQPGRPRWVILPRDKNDVCCHPGPGLECPAPIQPCL